MARIDHQTLKELEIFESPDGTQCLLNRLDFTSTYGGKNKLKEKLSSYYTTIEEIKLVQDGLRFILQDLEKWDLQLNNEDMYHLESYFSSNVSPIFSATKLDTFFQIVRYQLLYKGDYEYIRGNTFRFLYFLQDIKKKLTQHENTSLPVLLQSWVEKTQHILTDNGVKKVLAQLKTDKINFFTIVEYDHLFRVKLKDEIKAFFGLLYEMDAWVAMAKSIKKYNLVFPEFLESELPVVEFSGLYHLFLDVPVKNDLSFNTGNNFMFLTGPNTAGKTTLLKSCGIAIYLAHTGMGIPADKAKLSFFKSIFSNINPTDNLSEGYSYFYSEVRRVKEAVQILKEHKRAFILFDELFRGTNVKDAYDCSNLVIAGLQEWNTSIFILSSHITELAADMDKYANISFQYMETALKEGKPVFTYKLSPGISKERLGLYILEKERIFD